APAAPPPAPLHPPPLDFRLQPHRGLVRLGRGGLGLSESLLGRGNATVGLGLDLLVGLANPALDLLVEPPSRFRGALRRILAGLRSLRDDLFPLALRALLQ